MKVSVVIPVFNAAAFVRESVVSALSQPEVTEVLLVEDGSTDDSVAVCQQLAETDRRVRLLFTGRKQNRGAGWARNVGIKQANEEWISFLDADDFMLPNRFRTTREVIRENGCQGVYEAVGLHFETSVFEERWRQSGRLLLTTVTTKIVPEELFIRQSPVGRDGYAHTDGWTVHRSVFRKAGLFNPTLRLHQDTDLFMRFAVAGRMLPGEIREPVAMRRLHDNNRITQHRPPRENFDHRICMWGSTWRWARRKEYEWQAQVLLFKLLEHCSRPGTDHWKKTSHSYTALMRFQRAGTLIPELVEEVEFHRSLRSCFRRGVRFDLAGGRRRWMAAGSRMNRGLEGYAAERR